ncbi:hypothetical protein SAMD00019534_006160 [Acytostelium subglobosum LB1]|uniref:hypothetical protein n=1 Tax=Acytostelium subglobosum LB1 TaxID=1410327 RepID=UPI0006451D40|nr:hypothetical protein SAMD00019534_006160 [Acytostelium subglobosum LB1]GAM17441.1 hypothetical protein SAMD00019534_006160 [Acytostelium subglobosum LB1]|eukprot:XP_012759503.1 hypothetical protein SAMD00019534_006160 [Acytostelium subglobosum LB1]
MSSIGCDNPNIRELTFITHDCGNGEPDDVFKDCMKDIFRSYRNLTSLTIKSERLRWFESWEKASTLKSLTSLHLHTDVIWRTRSLKSYLASQSTIKTLTYYKSNTNSKEENTLVPFLFSSKCNIDNISINVYFGEPLPLVERRLRSLTMRLFHNYQTYTSDMDMVQL